MERKLAGGIGTLVGESPRVRIHPSRTRYSLQKYLLPLIMGGREDRKQLERMEASLSELSGSVAQTGKD